MIPMTEKAQEIQESGSGYVRYLRVESWLGGRLLASNVPVSSGREDVDLSARVPERVTLTVPRKAYGFDWTPRLPADPLAAVGQRIRIMLGVGLEGQAAEWVQRGEYLIQNSTPRGDYISVEAVGLLALIDEAKLVAPFQPTGSLASTLRALVEPALTVQFAAGLTDRAVPSGVNYDEDRLGAVEELLAAWPAEAQVNNRGVLAVRPVSTPATSTLLASNTTISADGESGRDNVYNAVVARGTAADGGQVQGVAYEYGTGPYRYKGPFNPLPVPLFFSSPLLRTVNECRLAAAARLQKVLRERTSAWSVTAPPLIHLQAGDRVLVATAEQFGANAMDGTVEQMTMPLTAGEGPMTMKVVRV